MKDGRRFGRPPNAFEPPATPAGKVNVTDLDSRNVKTPRGWVQGYNAQAAVTETQIVIAAEVTIYWHHAQMDSIIERGIQKDRPSGDFCVRMPRAGRHPQPRAPTRGRLERPHRIR